MSAQLLCGDTLLRLPSARIAREDVAVVRDTDTLLADAKAIRESALEAAKSAERAGYEKGREQALAEMKETLGKALAELTSQFDDENARRENEVAHAAMTVVEQLIGSKDDLDVVQGLARRALGHSAATIHVAPEWVDDLTASLGTEAGAEIKADPSLDRLACRITTGEGRIIADLDTQLANLRARWGLESRSAQ